MGLRRIERVVNYEADRGFTRSHKRCYDCLYDFCNLCASPLCHLIVKASERQSLQPRTIKVGAQNFLDI
jgi:hypothetical protein